MDDLLHSYLIAGDFYNIADWEHLRTIPGQEGVVTCLEELCLAMRDAWSSNPQIAEARECLRTIRNSNTRSVVDLALVSECIKSAEMAFTTISENIANSIARHQEQGTFATLSSWEYNEQVPYLHSFFGLVRIYMNEMAAQRVAVAGLTGWDIESTTVPSPVIEATTTFSSSSSELPPVSSSMPTSSPTHPVEDVVTVDPTSVQPDASLDVMQLQRCFEMVSGITLGNETVSETKEASSTPSKTTNRMASFTFSGRRGVSNRRTSRTRSRGSQFAHAGTNWLLHERVFQCFGV